MSPPHGVGWCKTQLISLPSGIRPLKIHSDFEKAPEKAPWITFKITSNVQFWGAFRRLKDRITVKLPSEGPSKCEKESNLKVIPGAFSVYSKRNLKVIWGALFNVLIQVGFQGLYLERHLKRPLNFIWRWSERILRGLILMVPKGPWKGPSKFPLGTLGLLR